MASPRRVSISARVVSSSIGALLTLVSGASPAAAEPELEPMPPAAPEPELQPMHAGAGMVRVRLSAGEHPFRVFFGRARLPIAACRTECEFWAWPGSYRVLVSDGEGPHFDATVPMRIQSAGSYAFVPANGKSQNAGLLLGASGPVIGVLGLVLTTAGLLAGCNEGNDQSCARPSYFYLGLGAAALGAGMSATGWLVYAHNRARIRFGGAALAAPRPSVALGAVAGTGLGLVGTLRF